MKELEEALARAKRYWSYAWDKSRHGSLWLQAAEEAVIKARNALNEFRIKQDQKYFT